MPQEMVWKDQYQGHTIQSEATEPDFDDILLTGFLIKGPVRLTLQEELISSWDNDRENNTLFISYINNVLKKVHCIHLAFS